MNRDNSSNLNEPARPCLTTKLGLVLEWLQQCNERRQSDQAPDSHECDDRGGSRAAADTDFGFYHVVDPDRPWFASLDLSLDKEYRTRRSVHPAIVRSIV